jgi:hypothetical protein
MEHNANNKTGIMMIMKSNPNGIFPPDLVAEFTKKNITPPTTMIIIKGTDGAKNNNKKE